MRLFIEGEKEISVVEAQVVEYLKETDEITIFDFNDNSGKIKLSSAYSAESTVLKLGSATGPIKLEGELIWD
jgi:hypothetical protein